MISKFGVQPDPAKIKAIKEMPKPVDKQGIMRILGMANYLQKFSPQMSQITAPMRDLLKKEIEFVWDDAQEDSFEKLKDMITRSPVLKYFNKEEDLVLQCDASERGLGACLMQNGQPMRHVQLPKQKLNMLRLKKSFWRLCLEQKDLTPMYMEEM